MSTRLPLTVQGWPQSHLGGAPSASHWLGRNQGLQQRPAAYLLPAQSGSLGRPRAQGRSVLGRLLPAGELSHRCYTRPCTGTGRLLAAYNSPGRLGPWEKSPGQSGIDLGGAREPARLPVGSCLSRSAMSFSHFPIFPRAASSLPGRGQCGTVWPRLLPGRAGGRSWMGAAWDWRRKPTLSIMSGPVSLDPSQRRYSLVPTTGLSGALMGCQLHAGHGALMFVGTLTFSPTKPLLGRCYDDLHFTDGKAEAREG